MRVVFYWHDQNAIFEFPLHCQSWKYIPIYMSENEELMTMIEDIKLNKLLAQKNIIHLGYL